MLKIFLRPFLAILVVALAFTSCSEKEEMIADEAIEPMRKSATSGPSVADISVGVDENFYKFKLSNGKPVWSASGTYWLGIVADERVREVYVFAEGKHNRWQRVDPNFGDYAKGLSWDVDAFLRNRNHNGKPAARLFNPDKADLNAFAVGPLVYITYGNKYAALRVDAGTVFRENGSSFGNLPNGISCIDYIRFPRTFDFYGSGFFLGVTDDGYVAGSKTIGGTYKVPTGKSSSDVNSVNGKGTAGNVSCLKVRSFKAVEFVLNNGDVVVGTAQRGNHEFIKVD